MISLHQSQFMPWIPYFYKVMKSDSFVILDNVQFQKNGVQNRNMIKTPQGSSWLTVPVSVKLGMLINEIKVKEKAEYPKLTKTLELNYARSEFFEQVFRPIKEIFDSKPEYLNYLNILLTEKILSFLNIDPKIYKASNIKTKLKKEDLVIEIIKNLGEDEYLSGSGALNYMDLEKFKKSGIKVYVSNFSYTEYRQLWSKKIGFLPDLSIVDLLFNDFEGAAGYIQKNGSIKRIA